jgi:hypothetical protein
LPHLPDDLKVKVKQYLKTEFEVYSPYTYTHIGWRDGKNRGPFELYPEDETAAKNWGPTEWSGYGFEGWGTPRPNYPPYIFYAMWKYALTTDNPQQTAQTILNNSKYSDGTSKLLPAPTDDLLAFYPFSHNAHISGRIGFLELQKLAGQTESAAVRTELNRLLDLRVQNFSKDSPYKTFVNSADLYCSNLNISRNFIFLVPELGNYLNSHIRSKITEALDEYSWIAPYWFAGKFEATSGEGTFHPYYDPVALIQAKALILKQSREELLPYLDAPAFAVGDLFYIQNLVSIIEAPSSEGFNPDLNSDSWVDFADYSLLVKDFGSFFSIFDFNRVVSFFGTLLNSLF